MFKHRYRINHDHFWDFGNQVTAKKLKKLRKPNDRTYYDFHDSLLSRFNSWDKLKNEKMDADSDSSSTPDHKCILNLKEGKKRVMRCSRCLQQGHYYKTCENEEAPEEIKKDFNLTKAKKKKKSLAFKIQRRKISKNWYLRNREAQRQKIKMKMRIRRKKRRQTQLLDDISMF